MAIKFRCPNGTDRVSDQNGRCGCLSPEDYCDSESCLSRQFICDKTKKETFSMLDVGDDMVGCGCFSTR